jgi:hypothetical protein
MKKVTTSITDGMSRGDANQRELKLSDTIALTKP